MTFLGVITAHEADAECLRLPTGTGGLLVMTSGGEPARAREAAEALGARGVTGLVSFGIAVGLAPVMRPGDVVVGERVVLPSGATIGTDEVWRTRLVERLTVLNLGLRVARVVGRDQAPGSQSQKHRAFQTTFAAALDTESHGVAEVAKALAIPFLVVRAVAEPAEQSRPAAASGWSAHGQRLAKVADLARLAARPWEIPAAWRCNQYDKLAREALRQVAALQPDPFAFRPN